MQYLWGALTLESSGNTYKQSADKAKAIKKCKYFTEISVLLYRFSIWGKMHGLADTFCLLTLLNLEYSCTELCSIS